MEGAKIVNGMMPKSSKLSIVRYYYSIIGNDDEKDMQFGAVG